jgi:lipooligosaccharide transport system permease protein
MAFGLDPSWGMLTVPLIAWLAGFGWACFGIMIAGYASSFENFNYVVSAVLTPLFLVDVLPAQPATLGADPRRDHPLYHCVQLVRDAVFGYHGWVDLLRVGALVLFGLVL